MSFLNPRLTTLTALSLGVLLISGCGGGSSSGIQQGATSAAVSDSTAGVSSAADAAAAGTDTTSEALRTRRTTTTFSTGTTATTTTTSAASGTWTQCAEENGTCTFSGTRNIKYGTTSAYVIRAFTGSTSCNNATFGDPAVGYWKYCWVGDATTTASTSSSSTPAATTSSTATTSTPATTTAAATSASTTSTSPATTTTTSSGPVTAAQWAEIATQRVAFGDPNDCKARVDAMPTTGFTLAAGGDIISALAANQTVLLQTGTYKPTGARLDILTGKKLVAAPGASPVLDLSAMTNFAAIYVGDNTTLAGIDIQGAQGISIVTYDVSKGQYSNGGLLYNLKVRDSGFTGNMDDGTGVAISGGGNTGQGQNWCAVAIETYNHWNPAGAAPVGQGGNSDGISSKFGAGQTTFIAVNSHNNGDDEIDMWQGGASYHYFSSYHDGGYVPGVTNGGDGNGVKLGTGSVSHKFYKTTATNNRSGGFNLNGNTMQPTLVLSTASGNAGGDYINGVLVP